MLHTDMRMLCLWLVNQLVMLTIIVVFVGTCIIGAITEPNYVDKMSQHTLRIITGIMVIGALLPAIFTAKFAKENYDDMISSGFIRWTSAINLWQSEWKFCIKTFFLSWIFYGVTIFFVSLIVCILLGLK